MNIFLVLIVSICLSNGSLAQRCTSTNLCYGYGDPHYIRFDNQLFEIQHNCKTVLLADAVGYNGVFTISAVPLRDTTTNKISIDSVRIEFGATTYLVDETGLTVNGATKALPFTDANIIVTNNAGTLAVDAAQFYLTFGNAFLKLVSCASNAFGICNSTEANPSLVMNKYLPNDLFWVGGKCVSCLNGWNGLNGRCYQRFDTASINYEQAQAECKAKNASLAILSTLNKFALAKSMVLAGNGAIVGGKAYVPSKFTYNDGSSKVLEWCTGEPNNGGSGSSATTMVEGCMALGTCGLNDISCTYSMQSYICEMNMCAPNQFYGTLTRGCVTRKTTGACGCNDQCDLSLGLSCQNGNCSCQPGTTWNGTLCDCQTGWTRFGSSCYQRIDAGKTFANAEADCESKKGTLVVISSADEFNFIKTFRNLGQSIYIGATASAPAVFTNIDGSAVTSNWNTGEPNNGGGGGASLVEDCVQLTDSGYNDISCSTSSAYACEISLFLNNN